MATELHAMTTELSSRLDGDLPDWRGPRGGGDRVGGREDLRGDHSDDRVAGGALWYNPNPPES